MNIVFCADRRVLPGLHVAAYSLLERMNPAEPETRFTVLSDEINEADAALLERTLRPLQKPFVLEMRRLDASAFAGFRELNGSLAAYYRLFAAQVMEVDRFLYVDADTLCDVDVSELQSMNMGQTPAGWVPEAPLARAVDRAVAQQLGNSELEPYFNSGVILVNVAEWRRQKVTQKAMEYIAAQQPVYHDQSALNVVLHRNSITLDERFNCIANMRKNWPVLRQPYGKIGRLVHFVDYPKPWDFAAQFVHPHYPLWRGLLEKTAMKPSLSPGILPKLRIPNDRRRLNDYKKAFKDRLLFGGYARGWLKRVKGVGPTGI
jgi:lipopolysaccharide biosynthesis glycosyltransferase